MAASNLFSELFSKRIRGRKMPTKPFFRRRLKDLRPSTRGTPMSKRIFGAVLGRRPPTYDGTLWVPGIGKEVVIHRDRWGVPYIEAADEAHAWFGQGFCQGQDRAFQLEFMRRVGRGTLSEVIGSKGLQLDRLARRIGFQVSSEVQYNLIDEDVRHHLDAYVRGINAGLRQGSKRSAHEFALLRSKPGLFHATDAINIAKLISFAMASNWDSELCRLKIMLEDGPDALAALDVVYPEWLQVSAEYSRKAGLAADRLGEDMATFQQTIGLRSASNNWVVNARKTVNNRPILANDPHLPANLPSSWYLSHVSTPERTVTGVNFVGTPGFSFGYNEHAAWGVTAGHIDNTDLFLEEIGPDGRSVRCGDDFVPCTVRREVIRVRGGKSVVEEVLVTPRGPVVSPAFDGELAALSLQATWLRGKRARGMIHLHHMTCFEDLRRVMSEWPGVTANFLYADPSDNIGWQLAGDSPQRKKGWGTIPMPGADPEVGWKDEPVPFDEMPHTVNPDCGFLATANNRPTAEGEGPFLGVDWFDGYRQARISEVLAERDDWTVESLSELQLDTLSIPWREIKPFVVGLKGTTNRSRSALALLARWDGRVSVDSQAATVFELFVAEMIQRVVRAKAPKAAQWAMGRGFIELAPNSTFAFRRVGHLVNLIRTQPKGWFASGWDAEMLAALHEAISVIEGKHGVNADRWAWGEVRSATLIHPVGEAAPFRRIFNLGPIPFDGDTNTISVGAADPGDPLGNPIGIATMRMAVEVGEWENNRWVLAGGVSGNPLSKHYDDQFELWRRGQAITIPFKTTDTSSFASHTVRLQPRYT